MRFSPIYLTLVHFLAGPKTVSAEKNELCEALVIRECSGHSRGLLKVLESGNKHLFNKECDALQVSDVQNLFSMTSDSVFMNPIFAPTA